MTSEDTESFLEETKKKAEEIAVKNFLDRAREIDKKYDKHESKNDDEGKPKIR